MPNDTGINEGDRIRLVLYRWKEQRDYTVEMFRGCLGVFLEPEARVAGDFTPLCELYEEGPDSKQDYIPNYGEYITNKVPAWMQLPRQDSAAQDRRTLNEETQG